MKNTHIPHDALFKKFLSDPKIAQDFLEIHLPKSIKELCDFSTLRLENTSFIEEHLKQHYADILYQLKITDNKAYIYVVVEAQSTPEKLMPFRMLRYQVSIMKRHLDRGHQQLPIVLPLLFYSGTTKPYPHSINLIDCFSNKNLAKEVMFKELKLIDLSTIPDEEIKTHKNIALLEGIMKHIYTRDALNLARDIIKFVNTKTIIYRHLEDVLEYIMIVKNIQDYNDFIEKIIPESGEYKEELMEFKEFFAEYKESLRQEGLKQGRRQEALEIAETMLTKGFQPELIKEITHLNDQDLSNLIDH